MEVSFVANSQTLTLFSCRPLSPTRLGLIRRDFLGTAHRLRPPGQLSSRRRRRCLSLFHFRSSPKFTVSASLSSQSVIGVVVAVFTFYAITVFYWNQYVKKKTAKKVTGPKNVELSQASRDASNLSTLTEAVVHHVVLEDMHAKEVKNVTTEMERSSHVSEQLHYQESSLFGEEIPTSTLGVATLDIIPSLDEEDSVHSNGNGNVLLPHLPMLQESERFEPIVLANELAEPQLEKHKKVDWNLHLEIIDKSHSAASLHHVWDFPEVVSGGDESTSSSYHDFAIESARADLYTFYDSKKSETGKVKPLSSFRKVSSQSRHVNRNALSSVTTRSMLKEHGLTLDDTILNKEDVGTNIPFAFYKEGSSSKEKGTVQGLELPRGKEGKELLEKNYRQASQMPHPNGVQGISEECAETQYRDYNILLRRGRVGECLKLLEDMEERGLLNMDKIYHGRFYDTCKNHKAVEEAFRFTNFISSPTLSTFNMLMSVCTNSQDLEGAFRVLQQVKEAGLRADCKLYTTLISTCAKCGKVDRMFEVFHEMVSAGVEPNLHTYGALIDGCARAGQVAKAFGAYGILRSKKVKPDRVVFNALITACGQCGAVDRAFDVLAEMGAEIQPIDPDHVTVGALMTACSNSGQVERAREVYKMLDKYKIKGTPEVYSIALNCCSQNGDWEFALSVYNDMLRKDVVPDEMFLSALVDVAGHAGNVDPAFQLLEDARNKGMQIGIISYSSLMGACSNAKNWEKAIKLYEDLKFMNMKPTISTMNALITALCEGDQLSKAIDVLSDMRAFGLCPNAITYSILLVASEKKDDIEVGSALYYQAKEDGVPLNITMCKCMIGMCLRRYEKACSLGEPVLSLDSAWPQVDSKWSSLALMVYRESILAGITPTIGVVSRVLGCMQFPYDASLKSKIIDNLGVTADPTKFSNLFSLVEGFGEYDPRAFSLLEEAASLGVVPFVSFKRNPILVDAKELHFHTAEVYILTVLRGLKHRLAAGAKLPNITIVLPVETSEMTSPAGEKTVSVAGRISQGVAALLRRMGIRYQGNESFGKIKINGLTMRRWLQPKLASPGSGKPGEFGLSQTWIAKGITDQQRDIRTGNLSLD